MYPFACEYTFSIYCHRRTIVYSYTIQTRRAVLFGQHDCDEHCVPTGHKYNIITIQSKIYSCYSKHSVNIITASQKQRSNVIDDFVKLFVVRII